MPVRVAINGIVAAAMEIGGYGAPAVQRMWRHGIVIRTVVKVIAASRSPDLMTQEAVDIAKVANKTVCQSSAGTRLVVKRRLRGISHCR